jgi:regulatory protein
MSESLERCHAAALRILQYRWNSELELRRKLARKEFDGEAIDATIARLREEKWLDDERFAASLVRRRTAKLHGRRRIANELRAAGIDDAEAAVRQHLDPQAEAAALAAACARRVRVLTRRHGEAFLTTDEGRNKLTMYLLNQGYDAALVRQALKEIRIVHHQPDP